MKKNLFLRVIALLLMISTLAGCFAACQGSGDPVDTDPPTEGQTPGGTTPEDTPGETDAETTPPVIWEDYVAPEGADVTDLKVSGTVAGSGGSTAQTVTYTFSANDPAFSLGEADVEGTRVTLRQSTVSSLTLNTSLASPATYEAKTHITGKNEGAPWFTLYIGLRLPNPGGDATGKGGIWIALREKQIGIRTGEWPHTSYMTIKEKGVDFKTERMLWVEDSGSVITVYAENDSGKKVALAEVKWEGDTVSMYHPGESKPALTDSGVTIPDAGYFNIWLHHMNTGCVYITDFKATGIAGNKKTAEDANMMNSLDVLSDTWVSMDDVAA